MPLLKVLCIKAWANRPSGGQMRGGFYDLIAKENNDSHMWRYVLEGGCKDGI